MKVFTTALDTNFGQIRSDDDVPENYVLTFILVLHSFKVVEGFQQLCSSLC